MSSRLKVLVVHNAYQHRGGEDSVFESEVALLRARGHDVETYTRHNDELTSMSRLHAAGESVWSRRTGADLDRVAAAFRPDIVHVHNTFPLISPSLYWKAAGLGLPVVQTLHNFRLHCPQAMYLRQGRVCEDCLGRIPVPAIWHACYRGSRAQSAVLAAGLVVHRIAGTWQRKIHRYIALNEFCRERFVAGGLPARRIVVKPNFVDVPAPRQRARAGFLYVGRLSPEKGIDTLAVAARNWGDAQLEVAGVGPEESLLHGGDRVTLLGALSAPEVLQKMAGATALIMPSIWYENFPRTLVEAFACGLPVIASRIGALEGIVEHGVTGLHFPPGNADALAEQVRWAQSHPNEMARMGVNARRVYESRYTADINYAQLAAIYAAAVAECRTGG